LFEQFKQNDAKLKETLNLFDKMMAESAYVCGNYLSVADFSILTSLSLLESADYPLTDWPNINKWLSNMKKELPYYEEINAKAIDNTRNYMKTMINK
jgi:glutathione S-transferase